MAQCFNWSLSTVDISTAFLHATLSEDEWQPVVLPPTTVDEAGNRLYLLLTKALYGLRRAPLAWYRELTSTLYKLGFSQTSESIVLRFVKHSAGEFILILLYVDDLLMAGSPSIIIGQLERSFKTNTTGSLGAGVYQRVIYCIVDKWLVSYSEYQNHHLKTRYNTVSCNMSYLQLWDIDPLMPSDHIIGCVIYPQKNYYKSSVITFWINNTTNSMIILQIFLDL